MAKRKITVTIDGYGKVVVKTPKEPNLDNMTNMVGLAVRKTLQLMTDHNKAPGFHPVLGMRSEEHG